MKFSNSKIKIEISEEELKDILQKHINNEYGKNVTVQHVDHLVKQWTEGYGMMERDYSRPNGLLVIVEE